MKQEHIKWKILNDEAAETSLQEIPKSLIMPSSKKYYQSLVRGEGDWSLHNGGTDTAPVRWIMAITQVKGVLLQIKGYVGKLKVSLVSFAKNHPEYKKVYLTTALELFVKEGEALVRFGFASDIESASKAVKEYLSKGRGRLEQAFWREVESRIVWVEPRMVLKENPLPKGMRPILFAYFGNLVFDIVYDSKNNAYEVGARESKQRFDKNDETWEEYFPFKGKRFNYLYFTNILVNAKRAVVILAGAFARGGIKKLEHAKIMLNKYSPTSLNRLAEAMDD